jgi:hypothetical protein
MSRYLTEKLSVVEVADFIEFACILEGVLEKRVFACGVFVVILWTGVWQIWIGKLVLVRCKKWDSNFDFIFGPSVWPRHPEGFGCGSYRG